LEKELNKTIENQSDRFIPEIDHIYDDSIGASELFTSNKSEETFCSICAIVIEDYTPQYFLDELVNSAFKMCKDHSLSLDEDLTADSLQPFTPKGFNHRPTNPSESSSPSVCTHAKQCIVQELFPSPLPALLSMVNLSSQYLPPKDHGAGLGQYL
jgi:hypothetical protein